MYYLDFLRQEYNITSFTFSRSAVEGYNRSCTGWDAIDGHDGMGPFSYRVKISTYLWLARHNRKTEEQYERLLEIIKVTAGIEATRWVTLGSENESLAMANSLASFCVVEYHLGYDHPIYLAYIPTNIFSHVRPQALFQNTVQKLALFVYMIQSESIKQGKME